MTYNNMLIHRCTVLRRIYSSKDTHGHPVEEWVEVYTNQPCRFTQQIGWTGVQGMVPDGACVCHSCDNPLCCNPAHLWLGTVFENNTDMITKGRFRIARHDGIHNPRARLTEFDVYSIRTRVQNGETRAAIAREYGVSYSTIDHAVRGISWKHLK